MAAKGTRNPPDWDWMNETIAENERLAAENARLKKPVRLCAKHEGDKRLMVLGWDDDSQDGGRDCMACTIDRLTRERLRTKKLVGLVGGILEKAEERATDDSVAAELGVSEWEAFLTKEEAMLLTVYKELKEGGKE